MTTLIQRAGPGIDRRPLGRDLDCGARPIILFAAGREGAGNSLAHLWLGPYVTNLLRGGIAHIRTRSDGVKNVLWSECEDAPCANKRIILLMAGQGLPKS